MRVHTGRFLVPLVLVLLGAGSAGAANVPCPSGWLVGPAPQAAAAVGPGWITPRGSTALVAQAVSASGTATVQLEMCCSPIDCTVAGNWAVVSGSVMSLTAGAAQIVSVVAPTCTYHANVTACSGCAVTVAAVCSGP